MRTTRYFREQVLRKRSYLQLSWIDGVLTDPEQSSVQEDGRIRFYRQRLRARSGTMKLHYYRETDSLYIDLADRPSAESRNVAPGVVLDFDANGVLVGIDIDHASQKLDLSRVETIALPLAG